MLGGKRSASWLKGTVGFVSLLNSSYHWTGLRVKKWSINLEDRCDRKERRKEKSVAYWISDSDGILRCFVARGIIFSIETSFTCV